MPEGLRTLLQRGFPTLLGVALCACASAAPPRPTAQAAPRASGSSTQAWSRSSWEERHDLMTFVVLPNMAHVFQSFAGTRDPELTCRSCHGRDADRVAFAMPHGLSALDPKHMPDPNSPDAKEARITRFMIDEVTPTMARLLGQPLRDNTTKQGISCFSCHPTVQP